MRAIVPYSVYQPLILMMVYLSGFSKLCLPYLDYAVNHDYIVANLCENKKNSALCHGVCYLNKELKRAAENEEGRDATLIVAQAEIADDIQEIVFTIPYRYQDARLYPPASAHWQAVVMEYLAPPPRS